MTHATIFTMMDPLTNSPITSSTDHFIGPDSIMLKLVTKTAKCIALTARAAETHTANPRVSCLLLLYYDNTQLIYYTHTTKICYYTTTVLMVIFLY